MAKILVVDDDVALCGVIDTWLKYQQHIVECVHTGKQSEELLELYEYDAIVLDWSLPDTTGVEICKAFRQKGGTTPIILLTGKRNIEEKETGLDAGADDYLTKPFEVRELSARLRALLRRPATVSENLLTVGDVSLDLKTHEVTKCGELVKLFPKDYTLLEYLMRRQNQICSPEDLMNHVWKSEEGIGPDALRTCVRRLRKQIDTEGKPSLIENRHGVGYILRDPT